MSEEDFFKALEELKLFVDSVPTPAKERKNMLHIAGYPSWENVISNILAFYFGDSEEHNFGRLFFDSLLQVLRDKNVMLPEVINDGSFTVSREQNNIDILICSDSIIDGESEWAIIIENKIYAELYNDLKGYWTSIKAKNKVGIVLNLFGQPKPLLERHKDSGIVYTDVLYKELTEKVKLKLHEVYEQSDDRHLLFLKDFLDNINTFYKNKLMAPEMQKNLTLYQQYSVTLDKVRDIENTLHDYVSDCIFRSFEGFGFVPFTNSQRVKNKHFYSTEKEDVISIMKAFRFWVDILRLLKYNELTVVFELHGSYTQYGPGVRLKIKHKIEDYGDKIEESGGGYQGGGYFHLAKIEGYNLDKESDEDLYDKLKDVLERNFFKPSGIVEDSVKALEELFKDQKPSS
jgi:hypothetical protein